VEDAYSPHHNHLYLGADAPSWVYSTAPLAQPDGTPVQPPQPGSAGHALHLSDQQVRGVCVGWGVWWSGGRGWVLFYHG
jgi:hypothetical protein